MAQRDDNLNLNGDDNPVNPPQQGTNRTTNSNDINYFLTLGPPQDDFNAPPPYESSMEDVIHYQSVHQPMQQQRAITAFDSVPSNNNLDLQNNLNSMQQNPISSQFLTNPGHQSTATVQQTNNLESDYNRCHAIVQNDHQHHHSSKLPTYEELELEKSFYDDIFLTNERQHTITQNPELSTLLGPSMAENNLHTIIDAETAANQDRAGDSASINNDGNLLSSSSPLTFLSINPIETENLTRPNTDYALLGRDSIFAMAFLAAFLFNWIGFLMITCFCNTVAARYGALSGFGLSLAKWTLIVKNSTEFASYENSWLWWLIAVFGILICVRAIIQYISIKRAWCLLSTAAQERFLFFY